ncbi:tautomerase family protein [Dyella sp.]|jgi:phenylpyruvate tautomerase PptA (4-oxalocrotonate tautomerase family)|uniref:tautomerase family protein n=1 Tax=Dyella sp. TaxID=1869338 RepID=UPI002CE96086|nr:tautomerase family protein [Dyella sp.]HTC28487.1 tautomerase family protein [Dyella sp.]
MPLYTLVTQKGTLDRQAKNRLAKQLTSFHAEYAGVPQNWVHVVFQDFQPGDGFTAGEEAPTAALTLLIRTGRSNEYKKGLLTELWRMFQTATGAPDDQIVIGIQEVSPSQAMEMGQIMPDVSEKE